MFCPTSGNQRGAFSQPPSLLNEFVPPLGWLNDVWRWMDGGASPGMGVYWVFRIQTPPEEKELFTSKCYLSVNSTNRTKSSCRSPQKFYQEDLLCIVYRKATLTLLLYAALLTGGKCCITDRRANEGHGLKRRACGVIFLWGMPGMQNPDMIFISSSSQNYGYEFSTGMMQCEEERLCSCIGCRIIIRRCFPRLYASFCCPTTKDYERLASFVLKACAERQTYSFVVCSNYFNFVPRKFCIFYMNF